MCLISVLPKGTTKYSDEVTTFIKVGVSSNRDGSGFMYKKEGDSFIYVKKGFKDAPTLLQAIKDANLKDNDELVVHHRVGTSGSKSAENNHPFVISHVHETIVNTNCKTDKACLVHNGVFWGIDHLERRNPQFSDTYAFTRYIMANSLDLFINEPKEFKEAFQSIIGSDKICVLFPDRDLMMMGNFTEENGYYHSHGGFKDWSYRDVGGRSSHVGFNTVGGVNSGACQLALPMICDKTKSIKQPLVLDGNLININSFNYKHFIYVPKDPKDMDIMRFESFDDNASVNVLSRKTNNVSISLGVGTSTLNARYTFHPLPSFEEYYKEYLYLLTKLTPSKNVFKDIYRLLQQPSIKDKHLSFPVKIKRLEVTKIALINYYFSLVENYMSVDSLYANVEVKDFVNENTPLLEFKPKSNREVVIMD